MQPRGSFTEAFDISDAFGSAIEHVKRVPAVAFVGGFLTMCTESSNNNIDLPDFSNGFDDPVLLVTALMSGVFFVVGLVQFFLAPLFEAGFIMAQREIVDDRDPQPSLLFAGRRYYARLLGWSFCWLGAILVLFAPMIAVIGFALGDGFGGSGDPLSQQESALDSITMMLTMMGVTALIALPILAFLWLSFSLTTRIVVCEDKPLFEAAKASWYLTNGRRLSLIPFAIVGFLFRLGGSLLGLLLCCVGIFFVYPFAIAVREVAWTRAYLWYVHGNPSQRAEGMAEVFR